MATGESIEEYERDKEKPDSGADVKKTNKYPQQIENDFVRTAFLIYTLHYGFITATVGICYIPALRDYIKENALALGIGSGVTFVLFTPLIYLLYRSQILRGLIPVNYLVYIIFVLPQAVGATVLTHRFHISYILMFYGTAAAASFMIILMSRTRLSMASVRVRYSIVGLDLVFLIIGICVLGFFLKENSTEEEGFMDRLVDMAAMMGAVFLGVSLVVGAFLTINDMLADGDEAVVQSDFLFAVALFYFTLFAMPWYLVVRIYRFFFPHKPQAKKEAD